MSHILQSPTAVHKKQISIESKVEQVVEDKRVTWPLRTRLAPKIRVVVSRENASEIWADSVLRPLNWSRGKTLIAYISLLLLTATSSALPLLLAPINFVISTQLDIPYSMTVTLTGVPILLGSFASLGTAILTRLLGRRGLLLGGGLCMLVGLVWNMFVGKSYGQFLGARAIQGIGWGMVGGVISESVRDIFSNHKSPVFVEIFNMASTLFTWSSPFLAGYVSNATIKTDWEDIFKPVVVTHSISLFLLIFFIPETHLNCSNILSEDEQNELASPTLPPGTLNVLKTTITSSNKLPQQGTSVFKSYIQSLRFPRPAPSTSNPRNFLLPLKALAAPSTLYRTVLTGPLKASTFGIASALALPVSVAPTFLGPRRIGAMFILPAALAFLLHTMFATISHFASPASTYRSGFGGRVRGFVATPALLTGASGIMAFGIYTCNKLSPRLVVNAVSGTTIADARLLNESRLWIVSLFLGLAVMGSVGMGLIIRPFYGGIFGRNSEEEDGISLQERAKGVEEEEEEEKMETEQEVSNLIAAASSFYTTFLSGIFVLAFPFWISSDSEPLGRTFFATTTKDAAEPDQIVNPMLVGLRLTSVALGLIAFVVGCVAALRIAFSGKDTERTDLKVLGLHSGSDEADGEREQRLGRR